MENIGEREASQSDNNNAVNMPLVVGVAGGSGSGKTTIATYIYDAIGADGAVLLQHDSYYRDQSNKPPEERARVNYDHPDSLDNELIAEHLDKLRHGESIQMPIYDFKKHVRSPETIYVEPRPVIVVEGILVFYDAPLRNQMNLKIFVDTDADLRFIRRLQRDIAERGRSVDSVIEQYLTTVRLMHQEFVEPTKRHADLIIPEGGYQLPTLLNNIVRLVSHTENINILIKEAALHQMVMGS